MNNTLSYKGLTAKVEFSAEDKLFVGRLIGVKEIVTFHGETVDELTSSMKETVDFYIEVCEKTGEKVKKSYSGKVMLRLPGKLHERIAEIAELSGKSINEWGKEVFESAVKPNI
ncbi:MAG: type II toxin-antitoxin system HicB family antitoxin [Pyrinomonadaceae bacterium]